MGIRYGSIKLIKCYQWIRNNEENSPDCTESFGQLIDFLQIFYIMSIFPQSILKGLTSILAIERQPIVRSKMEYIGRQYFSMPVKLSKNRKNTTEKRQKIEKLQIWREPKSYRKSLLCRKVLQLTILTVWIQTRKYRRRVPFQKQPSHKWSNASPTRHLPDKKKLILVILAENTCI